MPREWLESHCGGSTYAAFLLLLARDFTCWAHWAFGFAAGGPNQTDITVFITGDRITDIKPSAEVPLPEGVQVIDAAGKFLIPGLWNMHVHWYDARYIPLFIANGITGVRQMWGFPVHFQWRDEIAKGTLLGPRQAIAGIPIDGAEAFYPGVISVDNENKARQAARRVKESGADFIEEELNSLAYALFRAKKLKEAIEVFKFNAELHPQSFNAYDSLAEAYMVNGDQELAVKDFEKSLALNRFNWNAAEKLKKLKQE